MKKIKVLSMILALAMIVGVLAACNTSEPADTKSTDTNTSAPADTKSTEPATEPAESGELTLGIWPEDTEVDAIKVHTETYVPAFNEMHPNVTVVPAYYKYDPSTYIALAQSGNAPTVFESWYTEPEKLIRNGLVKDITDILEERGWLDSMSDSVRALLSDENGRVYGIPRDAYSLGLYINMDLFEQAGLVNDDGTPQYPKTWDEMITVCQTIREKTGKAGLCLLAQDNAGGWHWSNIAWAYGAQLCIDNGDGTFTSNLNTPEAIAAMELIRDLNNVKAFTDDPLQENWGTGFTQLGTGEAAMYIAANDAVSQPTATNGLPVDKLAIAPMPAGPGGQYSLMGGTPYMFSPDATDEEVNWALDYLEVMGKSPEVTDAAREGWIADAQYRQENGIPVIPAFPAWVGAVVEEQQKIVDEYSNVNMALYNDYYNFSKQAGALKTEEPGETQDMYAILTSVLQEVLTNPNADIPALMEQANTDYQAILDAAA